MPVALFFRFALSLFAGGGCVSELAIVGEAPDSVPGACFRFKDAFANAGVLVEDVVPPPPPALPGVGVGTLLVLLTFDTTDVGLCPADKGVDVDAVCCCCDCDCGMVLCCF